MIVNPIDLPMVSMEPLRSSMNPVRDISAKPSFRETLKSALAKVNDLQINSDNAMEKYVTGESDNLHELMISIEEAKIALQFTIEVRNRIIEAYQEIIRMQV